MTLNRRHILAAPALALAPSACSAQQPGLAGLLPRGPYHPGAALIAHRASDGAFLEAAHGDIGLDTPYFGASGTKLYVTAMLLQLVEEARLGLDAPFRRYLTGPETAGLNSFGGLDRTEEITIRQLMAHTSGLADYFEPDNSRSGYFHDLISGKDRRLTFGEAMEIARRIGASGPPGAGARAAYSDTNYQILGKVIETLDGAEFHTAFERRIVSPLGLSSTWIYSDPDDRRPRLLRYREAELAIPQAMTFAQADGGVVTTAREGLSFVRAFFEGRLFNSARLAPLQDFRPIFFPLEYGTGMMRFQLPGAMTGFQKLPPLIGHSGLSGAILFHAPDRGLSFAGTVNQVDRRSTVFKLLARAVMTVSREA